MEQDYFLKRVHLPSILLAFFGFLVSLYALIAHVQILLKPGHGLLCDMSATFNCTSVIGSSYGELASIPLGSYGMSYFMILFAATVMPLISQITEKQHALLEGLLAICGLITVLILIYITYFKIKAFCPTCSIVHGIVFIYSSMKVFRFFSSWRLKATQLYSGDYFSRFAAVSLCLGIPPLAAGLLIPMAVNYFSPVAEAKTPLKLSEVSQAVVKSTVAEDKKNSQDVPNMLSFHKSNFVGDGEDYRLGDDDAPVVVQVFSDFGCPHCKQVNGPLLKAQSDVGLHKVVLVYRFFPLSHVCNPAVPSEGWYPYSCTLAEATRCAGAQGKFWEFKEWGFSGQDWTDDERAQKFSQAGLLAQAKTLGIREDSFKQCLEQHTELKKIENDALIASKLNINGTPLILINGVEYSGPHTAEALEKAMGAY